MPYPPLPFGFGLNPPGAIACLAASPPAKSVNRNNAIDTNFMFIFFMFISLLITNYMKKDYIRI